MTKALATLLVLLVAFPPAAAAQSRNTAAFGTVPEYSPANGNRIDGAPLAQAVLDAGIDRGTQVAITLRNRSVITGRVEDVGAQSLLVRDSKTGNLTQIPYPKVSRLEELVPDGKATTIVMLATLAALIYVVAVTR